MEVVIDALYGIYRALHVLWLVYQDFILQKFPYGPLICVGAHVVLTTTAIYASAVAAAKKQQQQQYWLHSLVTVVLGCFGGGIIAPILLGMSPLVMTNDVLVPLATLIWYCTFHLGAYPLLTAPPLKLLLTALLAVFRTHSAVGMVDLALTVLKPGPFYPTPVMGPIIAATVIGSFAPFLPFDKGLSPIKKSMAWPMQAALLSSAFYLFMIHDQRGFIGQGFRAVFGTYSATAVTLIIGSVQLITLLLQFFFSPEANIFTPVHKLLYLLLQVQGPVATSEDAAAAEKKDNVGWSFRVRKQFEAFVDGSRWLVILLAVLAYASYSIPPATLPAVQLLTQSTSTTATTAATANVVTLAAVAASGLPLGGMLGVAQWAEFVPFSSSRNSSSNTPYVLQLQEWRYCKDIDSCNSSSNNSSSSSVDSSTVELLKSGSAKEVKYRLSVQQMSLASRNTHHTAATVATTATTATTATAAAAATAAAEAAAVAKSFTWTLLLPIKFSKAEQLTALDAEYDSHRVLFFVTSDGSFYLLSSAAPSGTLLQPAQLTGKLLWTARNIASCSAAAAASGQLSLTDDSSTAAAAAVVVTGLALDGQRGVPVLKCSDGSTVDFSL